MESKTTAIDIAYPETGDLHLHIRVGACRLRVVPGEGDEWVKGSYTDPSGALPCTVAIDGGTVRINQAPEWPEVFGAWSGPPSFDLAIGRTRPFRLTLEIGASESWLDLGGVPITALDARQGAGKYTIDFSTPNPVAMMRLYLASGAAGMEVERLANANCAEMRLEGGAAGYVFDFGGALQRDTTVRISAGLASVELRVPPSTAARVTSESLLGGLEVGEGFTRQGDSYQTEAARVGGGPLLTIATSVSLGSLRLLTT